MLNRSPTLRTAIARFGECAQPEHRSNMDAWLPDQRTHLRQYALEYCGQCVARVACAIENEPDRSVINGAHPSVTSVEERNAHLERFQESPRQVADQLEQQTEIAFKQRS